MNPETLWSWNRLWPLEARFWAVARRRIAEPGCERVLAQAARELLLLQASDWQFIITTGAAADYATRRFTEHAEDLDRLVSALEREDSAHWHVAEHDAETLRRRDDVFPGILPVLAAVLRGGR